MKYLIVAFAICLTGSTLFAQSIVIWGSDFEPLAYKNKTGQISGMNTEIVKFIVEDSRVKVKKWGIASWARAFIEAKEKPNTLLYSVVRKPDREALFHWIGMASPRRIFLFKLKSRTDIVINSWEDVKKYKVGSLRSGASTQYIESKGIKPHKLINLRQMLWMLYLGRIELTDMLDFSVKAVAKREGLFFDLFEPAFLVDGSKQHWIVMSKDTPTEIVNALRKSYDKLVESGGLKKIHNKYLQ